MESAIQRGERDTNTARIEQQSFADYELAMETGDRDAGLAALRRAMNAAANKAEYRRLLDDLDARLLTSGRVHFCTRAGKQITVASKEKIVMGRDPLCDVVLRSPGVSRQHAQISCKIGDSNSSRFFLHDLGSRNGTHIAGLPIGDPIPLTQSGVFGLGDQCTASYTVEDGLIHLTFDRGPDEHTYVVFGAKTTSTALNSVGIPIEVRFSDGKPILIRNTTDLMLNGSAFYAGELQLVRGDHLQIEDADLEIR